MSLTYEVHITLPDDKVIKLKGRQPNRLIRRAEGQYGETAKAIVIKSWMVGRNGRRFIARRTHFSR